jgi:DNA adenine methylase
MSRMNSPLRYPGGKSCLSDDTANLLRLNGLDRCHYAEPYAGGCGLALSLLFDGHVAEIHINDADPAVWAFWHCVLERTEELVELIETTPITIEEWHHQRKVYRAGEASGVLPLAFATFFLNRTNRSGIIMGAGVIGGLAQTGSYKLDCRFNRDDLVRRVRRVRKYREAIHLTRLDAEIFMAVADKELPKHSLFFIDPPYYQKGADLYTSFYAPEDHVRIARTVGRLNHPWVVTYDDVPAIRGIWRARRQYGFSVSYSVRQTRLGAELLIASPRLRVPLALKEAEILQPAARPILRSIAGSSVRTLSRL